jgi:hypothetical protein
VDHRVDLLSQIAASKTKLPYKTEKQTENCNKTQAVEGAGRTQPALEKGGRKKK